MPPITLRPADPTDKPAITALAAKIWDGEDYIHENFDEWVAQRRGRFIVAYSGDQLVGCNKLTEFRPGEWWMEGLRVDPGWRGQGIARLLHENIVRIAGEIAAAERLTGSLRFATADENHAVHKLALDTGFRHINQHFLYKAAVPPSAGSTPHSFTPAQPADKAEIESWFNHSTCFTATNGLFEDGWKWYEILPRLEELLQHGRIHWWRKSGSQPDGLIITRHRDPQTLVLNYLDTPDGRWADLLEDIRRLAQTFSVAQIESKPLALPEIAQALPQTTWQIDYDLEMWVFQRTLG